MITDTRCKELMNDVGMPDSISLMQALKQAAMESTLTERERCVRVCEKRAEYRMSVNRSSRDDIMDEEGEEITAEILKQPIGE